MEKAGLAIAVVVLIFSASGGSALADRPGARQAHQIHRIQRGVASGLLTRGEARELIVEQQHIRIMRHRAHADGLQTPQERRRLEHRQRVAGAHIERLKNNGRARNQR
jgi:hypothetical protein